MNIYPFLLKKDLKSCYKTLPLLCLIFASFISVATLSVHSFHLHRKRIKRGSREQFFTSFIRIIFLNTFS